EADDLTTPCITSTTVKSLPRSRCASPVTPRVYSSHPRDRPSKLPQYCEQLHRPTTARPAKFTVVDENCLFKGHNNVSDSIQHTRC
ncbi:hypothetical protein J6590_032762, partial [Homalodisca vitripennis]